MGQKGREIVEKNGIKADELITMLNKAYADEWLAYYQYWVGAKVAAGVPKAEVIAEMEEHAGEELKHADLLAERIIQLGGTPLLDPKDWLKESGCGYIAPKDPKVKTLIKQNIDAERCAIATYQKIFDFVKGKDPVTTHIVRHILQEEVEHEQDLEDLLEDQEISLK